MSRGGDINQRVTLELQGIGADTVTILAQAERELNAEVAKSAEQFNNVDGNATKLLGSLKKLAAQFLDVGKVAQSTRDFIARLNADLAKRDAEEAALDAKAKARLDAKAARDKKNVDDAVAAADKLVKAKEKEATAIAAADAKAAKATQDAVNQQIADEARLQEALGAMEARDSQRAAEQATAELERIQRVREADIKALGDRAQARARFERQVDQAIQSNRQTEGDAMRERIDAHVRAEVTTKKWADAQDKLAASTRGGLSATEKAANESKRFGQNMMSVAYAMDDVRYGFGAVVNNIPMVAQAAGASALWAANIAIVGIGIYELGKVMAPVATQVARDWGLMEDATKRYVSSIQDAKDKLEALQSKPYKVQVDYDEIAQAERVLEIMQERLNAFNAGRRDNLMEQMAKRTKETTHVYGGGTLAMEKAVAETEAAMGFSHGSGTDLAEAKKWEDELKQLEKSGFEGVGGALRKRRYDLVTSTREEILQRIRTADALFAKGEVGAFEMGDPLAIQRMQTRARRTPGAFSTRGPGGVLGYQAIADLPSTPEDMLRIIDTEANAKKGKAQLAIDIRNRRDTVRQAAKARDDAKRVSDNDLKTRTSKAVSAVYPGMDEPLESIFFHAEAEKKDRRATMALERPKLIKILRDRGVGEDVVGDAVEEIMTKGYDKALNTRLEGKLPRLDKDQAAAAMKAQNAARTAATKVQNAQTAEANRQDNAVNPYLQNRFAGNRLDQIQDGGVPEARMKAALTRETAQFLKQSGGDPALADEMVKKAFEDMSRQFLQNQALTNNAMASLVSLMEHNAEIAQQQQMKIMENMMKLNGVGNQMQRRRTNGVGLTPNGMGGG